MTEDKRLDESISRLVRGIQTGIPASVEENLHRKSASLKRHQGHPSFSRLLWTLLPSGAALILGVMFLMQTLMKPTNSEIAEIRTQFEVPDKNIILVLIQTPHFDFKIEEGK